MSTYFLDSSALVKRYMPETGTRWIRTITASTAGNDIVIAQITPVELISALSKQYHDNQINRTVLQAFHGLLMRHVQTQYQTLTLSSNITLRAMQLHESYRLRAYDSVQLASALELNTRISGSGRSLTFLAADVRLLQAALSEGLTTDNPNNYN